MGGEILVEPSSCGVTMSSPPWRWQRFFKHLAVEDNEMHVAIFIGEN
jgi:hypothetical protein